jgi:thiol-disulfide isomerase/thioredoxin
MIHDAESAFQRLLRIFRIVAALSAFICLVLLLAQAAAQKEKATAPAAPAAADPPLIDPAGYPKVLARYRGKPLLVNFWATWCEPCRDEFPMLVELAKRYKPKGLQVVGISFDDNADMNLVRRFLARNQPEFPNYRLKPGNDAEFVHAVSSRWNGSIPTTVFYTRENRIAGVFVGTRPRAEFEQAIQELLRASPPGATSAAPQAPKH